MSNIDSFPSGDEPQAQVLQRVIASGLPLATGLRAYAEECPSSVRSGLLQLASSIESGMSIGDATRNPELHLPAYLRGLIDGGVRSGSLGTMLEEYLHQRRLQRRFGQKVALDIAYPLLVMYFASLLCFVILVMLVPMFASIFESFGTALPLITELLINLSGAMTYLSVPIAVGFVFVGIALLLFLFGGQWSKALVDRVPFFGSSARYASMSEFCSLLAPLVETAVPLPEALQAVASTMQPSRLKSCSRALAANYDGSMGLADAAESRKFPQEIVHLLKWEQRGSAFGEILRSWAELFARMATGRSSVISAILAPLMIVGIGLFVGLILVALFMPLVKLLNELS